MCDNFYASIHSYSILILCKQQAENWAILRIEGNIMATPGPANNIQLCQGHQEAAMGQNQTHNLLIASQALYQQSRLSTRAIVSFSLVSRGKDPDFSLICASNAGLWTHELVAD